MPAMNQSLLKQALQENKLILNHQQQEKLLHYLNLLQRWNKVFNLTKITDPAEIIYLHFIDSLIIHPYLHGTNMLDVGSGGGFPGLPLAIMFPQHSWTLLDKNIKKTRFLTQATAELKLKNVEVVHARCEKIYPSHRYDTIMTRAFGTLALFLQTTRHLIALNGFFLAMKAHYPQKEIDDISKDFVVENVIRLNMIGKKVERHLVCIRKHEDFIHGKSDCHR